MSVRILLGDVREQLDTLEPNSVNCCVTSPPYFGLRSYLPDGHPNKHLEIGSEASLDDWVRTMVVVFGKVYRVMRKDGVMFLNLGDSYAGSRCGGATHPEMSTLVGSQPDHSRVAKHQVFTGAQKDASAGAKRAMVSSRRRDDHPVPRSDLRSDFFRPKEMHGQPWRAAFALQGFAVISCKTIAEWADMLQAARATHDWQMVELVEKRLRAWDFAEAMKASGWYLRQEIIWAKNNPMPESARDRYTKAHEHIFLFSKSRKYHWNFEAIQEPASEATHARMSQDIANQAGSTRAHAGAKANGPMKAVARKTLDRVPSGWDTTTGLDSGGHRTKAGRYTGNGVGFGHGTDAAARQRERVRGVNPKAEAESSDGSYADGKSGRLGREPGWRGARQNESFYAATVDVIETRNPRSVWTIPTHPFKGAHFATFPPELARRCIAAGCPTGGVVLDPFGGSGTVGLEADRAHCDAILIDLDERNAPMAKSRIDQDAKMFSQVSIEGLA